MGLCCFEQIACSGESQAGMVVDDDAEGLGAGAWIAVGTVAGGVIERALTPLPVFKLKPILVPLDFSDCSKKSLEYTIPFAMQCDAELTLLHVIQSDPIVAEMPSVIAHGCARGSPHTEIVEAAKELEADLIILSPHGRTGLSRALLGSTAEKVVRRAPCPVLVVREREHEFLK